MIHGKNLPKWIPHYAAMKPSTYFLYRQHQTNNCYQLFHQCSSWKTSQPTSRCDFPQEVSVTPIVSRNPLSILCIDYRHHQGPSTTRHNPIPLAATAGLRGELAAFLHVLCWLDLSASAQYCCPFLSLFFRAVLYWASVLLVQLSVFVQLAMGNEGSAPSSEESTPISDYPSMYSINSRLRSSVESTRAPSPMEAPEPDLSHLTPEEIAQIRSVMERAKNLQQEESTRARKLEEDYVQIATNMEREASLSEMTEAGSQLCSVCNKNHLPMNRDGTGSSMTVCVQCEQRTCRNCGAFKIAHPSKIQEWVCVVCDKRRRLMTTTGLWYHGYHPETQLPLEKQIVGSSGGLSHLERPDNLTSSLETSLVSNASYASSKDSRDSKDSRGSRDSRESRDESDQTYDSRDGSRCGGDSGLSLDLSSLSLASSQNSEFARQVYEQNRMKGPGANLPKSESDEFSDLTSDLDFDELASERSRPDGGSSTDDGYRDGSSVSKRKEHKKQKHRPKSLTLSRSHSHTSSDEEDGASSGGSDKKLDPPESQREAGSDKLALGTLLLTDRSDKKQNGGLVTEGYSGKESNFSVLHDSPTPPKSPSWREGLDSPPFSPRRRDSYPGKRRGSLSPKEKKTHFTYTDISPPSRQLSLDELYGDSSATGSFLDNGIAGSQVPQKPSPISPEEINDSLMTHMGETVSFDIPSNRAKPPTSIGAQLHHNNFQMAFSMPHSAPVMDLATYAATIANSTASLTSMSVSPTNLLPHTTPPQLQMAEPMSPDSADSSCPSPVSPGYYDNTQPTNEDIEEVELADPSSKSIDFQGTKRQKARPPSTDWSPVIDLSPILDVSPSVEEAEQEDMLAKQMEELERQRSLNAAEEDYDEEVGTSCDQSYFANQDLTSPVRPTQSQAVIPRIPPPPSAKKLKQQLNEEYDDEEDSLKDDGSFPFGSTLRRCGNFEDISRLGSDSSLIKNTSDLTADDRLVDDIDLRDIDAGFTDAPFFSCTSQASSIPHSAPCLSSTVSTFQAPARQFGQTEEQGTKQLRAFESMISDEIHKITEDMENIVKRGAANMKPIPPPKPKRRLPDPEYGNGIPPPSYFSDYTDQKSIPSIKTEAPSDSGSQDGSFEEGSSSRHLPRQDSGEKKKAKDLKAKPSPILIQHIEAEEQSVSPHYKVMESPPTPETKTIKREFSDSTSVSPSSSPDQDVYAFPSPVTPPDSDSSPPKPHSPSSPGTDLDEDIEAARRLYGYRSTSPYDNAKPTFTSGPVHTAYTSTNTVVSSPPTCAGYDMAPGSCEDNYAIPASTRQENQIRPPISPRKSIRKLDDQTVNGSPVYEYVKDVSTQDYSEELDLEHISSLNEYKIRSLGLGLTKQKGLNDYDIAPSKLGQFPSLTLGQHTEIFTYPVVGEFPGRGRSSSAPFTSANEESVQSEAPSARPRSASTDQESATSTSVRDKIRAFEEINSKPKVVPPPPEPRKDVMKDKRADSESSTSSSGSSSKTWNSKSSGEQSKPQDKEATKDGKKIRRKLPPIPVGKDPVVTPKSKNRRQKTPVKRSEGVDQEDQTVVATPRVTVHGVESGYSVGQRVNRDRDGYSVGQRVNRDRDGYSVGQRVNRDRDDQMNDDDLEVARLTTKKENVSPKKKTILADTGKSKSLDSSEYSRPRRDLNEGQRMKPPMQRTASLGQGPKDETDEIIDALIDIYGIPCTEAMKCLKKRLQEELRRVTKDRKRKLEELEEIRALQMQIGALKMESDARSRVFAGKRSPGLQYQTDSQQDSRKRGASLSQTTSSLTPRSSPQVTPRRQRHKRQSSDPMISKFSPIKEDKDIESDFQNRSLEPLDGRSLKYQTDDSSQSGISDAESTRSEPVRDARYSKIKPSDYSRILYSQKSAVGGSTDRLQYSDYDSSIYDRGIQPLSGSRSEQQLSTSNRSALYYSDDEESKYREEKKLLLQYEIMKRKQQLEETARLKSELLKLARARQTMASSYDDIPRHYAGSVAPQRPVPRGIIKPIEDEAYVLYDVLDESRSRERSQQRSREHSQQRSREHSQQRSREHSRERSRERSRESCDDLDRDLVKARDSSLDNIAKPEQRGREPRTRHHSGGQQHSTQETKVVNNYSSTEYLVHKQESATRRYMDEAIQYGSQGWIAGDYPSETLAPVQAFSQPVLNKRLDTVQAVSRREEPGIVSSVTLPNIYAKRMDREFRPVGPYRDPNYISTSISDTDGSPASDITPAMPLLDDVKTKSRTIIRNIGSGSRPVSAEFSAGDLEDLLNGMYRVESDNSVDADEPIMKHMTEGGVTILKQIDRKKRPAPVEPHRYDFPIKRILVTRDAKDKSITGSGLGMKIVGGKEIPGTNDIGAYVTAIYPIIADQLHGELDVGDQVLEWNGIYLTGLSADEVQDIISQTNGEIEMVVRAQMIPLLMTELTAQPESCRSSYDNLALPSYEESVKEPYLLRQMTGSAQVNNRQGVDPRQLAAQLEGIREAVSPAENSPSSSHQDVATPSISSPCSTPRSDPTSTSSDRQQPPSSRSADRPEKVVDRHTTDRPTSRQRRKHSPNPGKSTQQQGSPQKQQMSTSQPLQPSPPPPYILRQQASSQQNNASSDAAQTEQVPVTRRKKDSNPMTSTAQEKSRSSAFDQPDSSSCSSPALNDRLRASPPLDTRRSIKARPSKKGKDNFVFPTKILQEPERGEDYGLGEIQLQISHDDFDNTLNVHVIQARNLRPRDLNGLSDPFVKLYLLPGRGPENKRRTKHIARTLNPEWHQTVMFQDVARLELQNKVLEITVWDYDRFKANDFLGELIIELREFAFLDNKPHWYPLKEHVTMQSFELPKSTVAPPKPAEITKTQTRSPRQGKKHGISSLRPQEALHTDGEAQRRRSLGTISGNNANETSASREISSATNSPIPPRRPRGTKSPIKTRSNGLLYR